MSDGDIMVQKILPDKLLESWSVLFSSSTNLDWDIIILLLSESNKAVVDELFNSISSEVLSISSVKLN